MALPASSVLDTKPSRVIGFPLTVNQQLWLMYLLPSLVETVVYILDLATDVAIGMALINEGHSNTGSVTLGLVYLPPLVCLLIALASPPDGDWLRLSKWILVRLFDFILFPLRPIRCFSERLVWAIEAIRLEDPEREEALIEFEKTRRTEIETYFFLRGFLQAAPQIVLQIGLIVWDLSESVHTNIMQGLCVITSVMSLALVCAAYQRYESQCKGTRRRVWPVKEESEGGEAGASERLVQVASGGVRLPRRVAWLKVTAEDDPFGKAVSFLLWFMLLVGRLLALVVAARFCPWAVLAVCAAHYVFNLIYIMPEPRCRSSVMLVAVLALVHVFVLVEVGLQFRKVYLFAGLFFLFACAEDLVLTLVWAVWGKWSGWWYHYAMFVMAATHVFALVCLVVYYMKFNPKTKRIKPDSTDLESFA